MPTARAPITADSQRSRSAAAVVVPNWNGAAFLTQCIDSLLAQSLPARIIVVENGSSDDSLALLAAYPSVEVIEHAENRGFAGGVNPGFRRAMQTGCNYVAAFNSDAVADPDWLALLAATLDDHPGVGIATCKLVNADGTRIDSTGDCYTSWGLPYPRGRHESELSKYDDPRRCEVFGASGGASLYRSAMLREVGLFDEVFFAYFEDVDLSFRAQLGGWKIRYVSQAVVFHQISATSSRISGFATQQYCRNVPRVLIKNVPRRLLSHVGPRFVLGYGAFLLWALREHEARAASRGVAGGLRLLLGSLGERRRIQAGRVATDEYIWEIMVHGLPPRARSLHRLRAARRRLRLRARAPHRRTVRGRAALRALAPQLVRERLYEWHPGRARRWARHPGVQRVQARGQAVLTFDDGPDQDATPAVLDALDGVGVKATFFVLASQLDAHADLGAEIVARGHEIALHGYAHERHDRIDPARSREDVERGFHAVAEHTGVRCRWYRPPYGKMSAASQRACLALGMSTVYWSAWGMDWEDIGADRIAQIAGSQIADGAILLLHDSARHARRQSATPTAEAIPAIAAQARARGIELVALRDAAPAAAEGARA